MPASGRRSLRKARSQQQSMEGTAAEAARGSGLPSPVSPSSVQHSGSTDTEDRCPICLDSWRELSFVMPCLHCFCYACILQWADNKTQCPLCKRKMTSILHSVRADDDFQEQVIIPPMMPPVILPRGRAHREPDAYSPYHPGAHQEWETAGGVQDFVGDFQLPNWMSCFSANLAIEQILHLWFCHNLEMLFETATSRAQHTHVPEQQRCRDLPRQCDTRGATRQEDNSPRPARSTVDEIASTSSSAIGGGPSPHPSASTAVYVEQESQEEPERLSPPNSVRGRDPSTGGQRRPRKRRASRPKGSPAHRRPRH